MNEIVGAIGVIIVIVGFLHQVRKTQDMMFLCGKCFLLLYTILIWNVIFMLLQLLAIGVISFDLWRILKKEVKK